MRLRAWGIAPSERMEWMQVLDGVLTQRIRGTPLAATTIRNLRDLEGALELGVKLDRDTRRRLMQAMDLLRGQLATG